MKRQILKDFELTEISGVDRPAQPTAVMAIIKRKSDGEDSSMSITKGSKLGDRLTSLRDEKELTNADLGRAAGIDESTVSGILSGEIQTPPERRIRGFARALMVSFDSLQQLVPKMEKSDIEIELESKVEELTKNLTAVTLLSKLDDDEKRFRTDMDDNAKKAFDAMTEEERKAKMALAKAGDETLVVAGETISKNVVGASMFAVIKSQQADLTKQQADTKKAQETAEMAILTKRAGDDFNHLTGTPEEIAKVLQAFDAMPEAVRKTAEAVFTSAEELSKQAFIATGVRKGVAGAEGSATEQLDTLAKAHAETHKIGYAAAYASVIEKRTDLYDLALEEAQ